jgi:hypothetical protein
LNPTGSANFNLNSKDFYDQGIHHPFPAWTPAVWNGEKVVNESDPLKWSSDADPVTQHQRTARYPIY